jgi:hypothetical protein
MRIKGFLLGHDAEADHERGAHQSDNRLVNPFGDNRDIRHTEDRQGKYDMIHGFPFRTVERPHVTHARGYRHAVLTP